MSDTKPTAAEAAPAKGEKYDFFKVIQGYLDEASDARSMISRSSGGA